MLNLQARYYLNLFLSVHRGFNKGIASNAKPLYILAIIDGIDNGIIIGNKITYNYAITSLYNKACDIYEPLRKRTLFYKPFFHMEREPFYFIKLRTGVDFPSRCHTPSSKFLREQVDYAALDDDLWELLQSKEIRDEYREAIINHFIKA